MRLTSAHIAGYGRLIDSKVNLDSKVIAIVGPNEAGKTTLLKALAYVEAQEALSMPERSRAVGVEDTTQTIRLNFVLDEADQEALKDIELQEPPRSMWVVKKADGTAAAVGLEPRPKKPKAPLERAVEVLAKIDKAGDYEKLLSPDTVYADPNSDAARDFSGELNELFEIVHHQLDDNPTVEDIELSGRAVDLIGALSDTAESTALKSALENIKRWGADADPAGMVREALFRRKPKIIMFDESDRSLKSSYTIDDNLRAVPPVALQNLADVAKLDLSALITAARGGDIARRDTQINKANKQLEGLFGRVWKQSQLAVKFSVDGAELRINVLEDGENVTMFSERSAGFRMFVALVAFLARQQTSVPPILLVDEAENHLHIDAQADLVNMFIAQKEVAKVIYTTHSPACLPPDLGVGVRAVVPRSDKQQVSEIKNSFWTEGAGYSPLLIAMGAGAAAFSSARYVVLAEGATEMMILPSLLRKATGLENLPYQVAPGLSEVPKSFYPSLDLEGAKVAYVVDDDAGGRQLIKALIKGGVPAHLIVTISAPGIENVLPPEVYQDTVRTLLLEHYTADEIGELPQLVGASESSWAEQMEKWLEDHALKMPSKVAVANRLLEQGKAEPANDFKAKLVVAHQLIVKALGL